SRATSGMAAARVARRSLDNQREPPPQCDAGGDPMDGVVNCASYSGGRRVADLPIADISEALKRPGQFIWVGLHEPDEALLRQVQEEFGLHDLAIEDALRAHQRPKVEQYGNHLFVVLRTAQRSRDTGRVEFGETHFF